MLSLLRAQSSRRSAVRRSGPALRANGPNSSVSTLPSTTLSPSASVHCGADVAVPKAVFTLSPASAPVLSAVPLSASAATAPRAMQGSLLNLSARDRSLAALLLASRTPSSPLQHAMSARYASTSSAAVVSTVPVTASATVPVAASARFMNEEFSSAAMYALAAGMALALISALSSDADAAQELGARVDETLIADLNYSEKDRLLLQDTLDFVYPSNKVRGAKDPSWTAAVRRILRRWWNLFRYSRRIMQLMWAMAPAVALLPYLYLRPSFADTWWQVFVRGIERAGPAFIKFGQWASSRADLFSVEVCDRLGTLRNRAPEHSLAVTEAIFLESFGKRLDEVFDSLDPTPIASGSIAQVYRGILRSNGQDVAVKVRHPWVVEQIATDIMIMYWFAKEMSKYPTMSWMELPVSVKEFAAHMAQQINLRREGHNLLRFIENFKDIPKVFFPHPIQPYISDDVLVETFEEGKGISYYLSNPHPARSALAHMGLTTFLKMLLVDNFIHADCHAENILVRFDEVGNPEIVMLDAGLVTELQPRDRENVINLFKTMYFRDGRMAGQLMSQVSANHANIDYEKFNADMQSFFSSVYSLEANDMHMSDTMNNFFSVCRKHKIKLECNLAMLAVSAAVLEGLALRLDPTINMMLVSVPFLFGDTQFGRAMRYISTNVGRASTEKRQQLKPYFADANRKAPSTV